MATSVTEGLVTGLLSSCGWRKKHSERGKDTNITICAAQTRACWNSTKGLFLVAFPFKLVCDASQVGPRALAGCQSYLYETGAAKAQCRDAARSVGLELACRMRKHQTPVC